jgi:hypothetical protein
MSTTHPYGPVGSADGHGAGDHASSPYPFSERQYARLLVLRSCVQEQLISEARARSEP